MIQYKIKDLELLTGIKAHTLRIWEKRYGLLSPERTDTQIRHYSEDELIKLIKVSVLYCNDYKISKIAKLSDEEIDSIVETIRTSNHCCTTDVSLLIEATIKMKCDAFNTQLSGIIESMGLENAFESCIGSFFEKIESLGNTERINPAQKHFVYNLIRQKLIAETDTLASSPNEDFDALLFTPEGEYNEIALLFYNYLLKKRGLNTLYLGVKLPIHQLESTLRKITPKAIVVSLIDSINKEGYIEYLEQLNAIQNVPIYIGGSLVESYGLFEYKNIHKIEDMIHQIDK